MSTIGPREFSAEVPDEPPLSLQSTKGLLPPTNSDGKCFGHLAVMVVQPPAVTCWACSVWIGVPYVNEMPAKVFKASHGQETAETVACSSSMSCQCLDRHFVREIDSAMHRVSTKR